MFPADHARTDGSLPRMLPPGTLGAASGIRYQLVRHLATGGMAEVFLARRIGRSGGATECVIKQILPHLAGDPQFVTMFLDEARLCARFDHPNIAHVYDHGQAGDDYFIAMEYVDGADLDQLLDKLHAAGERRLPFGVAARIVCGVADGLEHAHQALDDRGQPLGLVHRDVTPSNVVVSFAGVPKLLDFGIAKASSRRGRTEVGVIKGKVPYMSPEQVAGEPLDGRSDLFSLGCILYELTTGDKPWKGENSAQLGLQILHDEPTPPTLLLADFPVALEEIIMAAMAKRPSERTQSARVLATQLEAFLAESGRAVTSGDVAAYVATRCGRVPVAVEARPARTAAAGGYAKSNPKSVARGEDRSMEEQHNGRPTGPLSIGDASLLDDLPGAPRKDARRSLGGGGGAMAIVAAVVVVAVGVGFFLLRGYEQNRENAALGDAGGPGQAAANPPSVAPIPVAPAPIDHPTPVVAAKPIIAPSTVEKAAPTVTPERPQQVVPAPARPTVAAVPDQPRVTPLAPEPKKPSKPHHAAPHHEIGARPLPRLPTLPVPSE